MRRLHHSPVGGFSLRFETFRVAGDTDQALITYNADRSRPRLSPCAC
ncbi:hypothetical protein [Streptomyces sp. MBT33]|nr:hypothetical protein [Streptomyces sp. MBT33]